MLLKRLFALCFAFGFFTIAHGKSCEDAEQFRVGLQESIDSTGPDRQGNITYYETRLNEELKKCGLEPIPTARVLRLRALLTAESKAKVSCKNRLQCEKVFSLTQIFIVQHSDTKVQVANDTVIETYNPTGEMKISLKAIKVPRAGTTADVLLKVHCGDGKVTPAEEVCHQKSLHIYEKFPQFIRENLVD